MNVSHFVEYYKQFLDSEKAQYIYQPTLTPTIPQTGEPKKLDQPILQSIKAGPDDTVLNVANSLLCLQEMCK